jgi:amidohydrolase family protein/IPT/TIG domain-containing protein
MRTSLARYLLIAAAAGFQAQSFVNAAQGGPQAAPSIEGSLLISGGTLIDGTGAMPLANAQVLVRDGMIAEITTSPRIVGDAELIDARGKFILPGFIDSHVHYRDWHAELFLAHGVTTVYDLGNPYYWQAALRQGFNSGRMRGPRYFFCGEIGLPSDEAAESQGPTVFRRGLDTIHKPDEAPAIVGRLKRAGVDCIKLNENFPADFFSAIARAAQDIGLRVISHSWNVSDSIRWGIGGVEHMEGIAVATAAGPRGREAVRGMHLEAGHKNSALYQWMEPAEFTRVVRELVEKKVFVNPTLSFEWKALTPRNRDHEQDDQRLLGTPALSYVPIDDRLVVIGQYHWPDGRTSEEIGQFKDGYRKVQQFLAQFVRAGGKVYAGTDSSAATSPGLSLHHEMQLLVDAGLTPMQAIMAATANAAELLGLQRRIGTIERGKAADLVLLDANPLQEIANTKKIFKVIANGRVVDTTYHAGYEIPIRRPGPESKHLYNPIPIVRDVLPPVAVEGAAVTLRIVGRGFTPNSVVKIDGRACDTRWISPTELAASLTAENTARAGTFLVTVETPAPGGGSSNPVELIVTFQ